MSGLSFGLMAIPRRGSDWIDRARWAEANGFTSLLLPDTLRVTSPFPALAAAAATTATLRLRPWVLSAPLRTPAVVVREVSALQLLSGSRFELGVGIGRPGGESEAAQLGMTWGSATRRRALVRAVVEAVRAAVAPVPPVVITASGPSMLSEAAGYADRIGLALGPTAPKPELARLAGLARATKAVPLTLQLSGIGEKIISWGSGGAQSETRDVASVLPAEPGAAAELLEERLERFGIDELVVPEDLAEDILPVMRRLG